MTTGNCASRDYVVERGEMIVLRIGNRVIDLAVDHGGNVGVSDRDRGCWLPPLNDDHVAKSAHHSPMEVMANHTAMSDRGAHADAIRGIEAEEDDAIASPYKVLDFMANLAALDLCAPGLLVLKIKNKHASLRMLGALTGLGKSRLSELLTKIDNYDRRLKRVLSGQQINRSEAQRRRWKKKKRNGAL